MSRLASVCAVLALATSAAGCATTAESTAQVPRAASGAHTIEQDYAYMQRVEDVARSRGIDVNWVNPPSKRRTPGNR